VGAAVEVVEVVPPVSDLPQDVVEPRVLCTMVTLDPWRHFKAADRWVTRGYA